MRERSLLVLEIEVYPVGHILVGDHFAGKLDIVHILSGAEHLSGLAIIFFKIIWGRFALFQIISCRPEG